jgi:hypothetical protein
MKRSRYVHSLAGDRRACVADYLRNVSIWDILKDWRLIRWFPERDFRLMQALDDPFGPAFALSPKKSDRGEVDPAADATIAELRTQLKLAYDACVSHHDAAFSKYFEGFCPVCARFGGQELYDEIRRLLAHTST